MEYLDYLAAGLSLLLMGICGVRLVVRFVRVLRGQEAVCGSIGRFAPRRELMAAALAALLSRLLVYLIAYAMHRAVRPEAQGFLASLEPLWTHWDTRHYTGIALEGYTAVGDERLRLVFFPLYPMLMRLLSVTTGGNVFYSGLLISLVCASLAAALLYDLAFLHGGRRSAVLACAYFLLSPLSVFLCCVYTEALFICLTLAAVCLIRRDRPYLAALCGMASAFTRMPGVIVAGLLMIRTIGHIARKGYTHRAVLACAAQVAIVFLGLFAYFGINYAVTGDPLMYMTYQRENWFQEPGSFWSSTQNTAYYFLHGAGEEDWLFTWGFQLLCMFVTYLLLAFCAQRLAFDLAAYSFVYVAVVLSPTWLLSGARYLYALCTAPLLLCALPFKRRVHGFFLAASGVLLLIWIFGYTIAVTVL